jgi:hypothetical protein
VVSDWYQNERQLQFDSASNGTPSRPSLEPQSADSCFWALLYVAQSDYLTRHLRYKSIKMSNASAVMGRRYPLMCYSRKDRDLEREARWITEKRLMEEEARHRQEEHDHSRVQEKKPLTEKIKEVVGVR